MSGSRDRRVVRASGVLGVALLCTVGMGRAAEPEPWSFRPLVRPAVPTADDAHWARNPIDHFVLATLREHGLTPSPEADRRTLLRRVTYDLTGLPPSPEDVDAFVADPTPDAYEKRVDRLLASPAYGERWGRHWLDVVHYGDTHGYDKDKLRPNAWPYRDYVIRAFNTDKPYGRFVEEQLAGDALYPGTGDGIVALGFIAAGPFDYVGQVELADGTLDKAVTRNLDRDDMVTTAMNSLVSLTVQCARCHNHKFDPIRQEDYYSLQAVFAGVDRADRPYDADPVVAAQRLEFQNRLDRSLACAADLERKLPAPAAARIAEVDAQIAAAARRASTEIDRPGYGYHSGIEPTQDRTKWVQVDLGKPTAIVSVVLFGAHDTFNGIGDGFGVPVRFKIEASDDASFATGVRVVADATAADQPNPGVRRLTFDFGGKAARYIRVTATKLAPRQGDFIFALGELEALTPDGQNAALGRPVTALDSIEAPPRWGVKNLVDGYAYGAADRRLAQLREQRAGMLAEALDGEGRKALEAARSEAEAARAALRALPTPSWVFAASSDFTPSGSLTPTHGKAREIRVLKRGSEKNPGDVVGPGTVSFVRGLPARFDLPADAPESRRRAALARWVTDPANPLTWRSIVNRVWQYNVGQGIIETPNDFGKMGAAPTHPQLLDWLAVEFRDGGEWIGTPQSIKALQRLIVTSSTYRQSSSTTPAGGRIDAGNQYLWRMNRRRLDAEEIRDSVLLLAGKLDRRAGGPPFMNFGFKDDESPHYLYDAHDPDDPASCRRSVYRLIVRSVPDPLMQTLDCADPSQLVPRRNETLTPLQALSMLNNPFMVKMAAHFSARVSAGSALPRERVGGAVCLALGRPPTQEEAALLERVERDDGMPNVCRLIINLNEFVFVD